MSISKRKFAASLFVVALLGTTWPLFVGRIAPFGSEVPMFIVSLLGGIASFIAVVFAWRQPRQLGLVAAASVVAVSNLVMWSWVAVLAIAGGA
jgi:hypothetical protein